MSSADDQQDDPRFEEVLAEYLRRIDEGEQVDQTQFIAAHAEFADALREYFETAGQIERMAVPIEETLDSDGPALASSPPPLDVVRYFGDYELLEEIARGGMGVVYKARQASLNRIVALKMILAGNLADEDDVRRFHAEAEAAANLDHPGIVPIHEVGEHEGQHFFSMGFVEGSSLSAKIADGPLPPREAAEYTKKVAEAVAFAHEKGVIHRDLKPANVLLDANDEPKVTDFGLAKKIEGDSGLTATGQVLGTPAYMPPEQASGKIDEVTETADVYSLGAILYNLLTARPPFQADNPLDTLMQVLEQEPVSPCQLNPKVPQDLETICLKCLEKARHRRYASAQDLVDELQRFVNGEPILARPISTTARVWRWCKRRPLVAGLGVAVALLVLLVAIASPLVALRETTLRKVADTRAEEARAAKEKTEVTLVDMYTSAGLVASERGEPAQAVLWFANAARLANSDPQRRRTNRIRVRTWSREVTTPVCVLEHGGKRLQSIQFHAGGKHLVTLTKDYKCTVWDLETERPLPLPGGDRPVRSVAFSPDGQWLALGRPNGNVDIFSFPAGEHLHRIELGSPVVAVVFSREGSRLAIASKVVRVWDCQSHGFAMPELVHPKQVLALAFSASGERLATGCADNQARVYAIEGETARTEPLFPPVRHRLRAWDWCVPISPIFIDQDHGVLTVTDSHTVAWRDATTGKQIRSVPSNANAVHFIAASPDGRHFALGGYEKTSLWDIANGRLVQNRMMQPGHVLSAVFSPDGATLITGSENTVRSWSVPDGEPAGHALQHQAQLLQTAFSPDGRYFATGPVDGLVRVWRAALANHPDQRLSLDGSRTAVKLSCGGRYLIPTGSSWYGADLRSARVYDVSTFQAAGRSLRPGGILTDSDLSPDGRHAVTLNTLGQAHFWDWHTGEPPFDPVAVPAEPRSVRYTPDGRLVIVACSGGQVLIIDPATGQITSSLKCGVSGNADNVGRIPGDGYLDISFDGRRFLSCSIDRLVRVCDTATGDQSYDPLKHRLRARLGRFSSDSRLLLTAEKLSSVRIWDATTGCQTGYTLKHPLNHINDACFSPSAQYVLTACEDGMARMWDWRTGTLVCPPFQHARGVGGACFTSDGAYVLTAARDLTARVWEWHTGKPITPPLSISGRGFRVITTPDGSHAFISGEGSFIDVFDLGFLYQREDLDLEDLRTFGEILSGQRIHEGGGVVNLTGKEWVDRWKQFQNRHPGYLCCQWSAEEMLRFHRREADEKLDAERWLAAIWHLDRLIVQEPENWRHYRDRSRAYGALGQTNVADSDHAKAFELMPAEAKWSLLESRTRTIAQASAQQQQQTLAEWKDYLAAKSASGLGQEDVRLAISTIDSLAQNGNSELAASACESFAEVIGRSTDESSTVGAKRMEGALRRLTLIGKKIEYQGHKLDGSPFDGTACQGKVVLADFWTSWCPNWQTEINETRRNYHLYHNRGLEIVSEQTHKR